MKRESETGIRAEVRRSAEELRTIGARLSALWGVDDPTLAADGARVLRLVANGVGLQAGWGAEELMHALDIEERGETLPPAPLGRIGLTVPRESLDRWVIAAIQAGGVEPWLTKLADAEIERIDKGGER
jgi:hypothetical protein